MVKAFILGGIVAGLFIFFFGCGKFEDLCVYVFYSFLMEIIQSRLLVNIFFHFIKVPGDFRQHGGRPAALEASDRASGIRVCCVCMRITAAA